MVPLNLHGAVHVSNDEWNGTPYASSNFTISYWESVDNEDKCGDYKKACKMYEQDNSLYPKHPKKLSLYEFTLYCNHNWMQRTGPKKVVPHPIPYPYNFGVPSIDSKDHVNWCRDNLLLHKPRMSRLKLKHDDPQQIIERMEEFTSEESCPQSNI